MGRPITRANSNLVKCAEVSECNLFMTRELHRTLHATIRSCRPSSGCRTWHQLSCAGPSAMSCTQAPDFAMVCTTSPKRADPTISPSCPGFDRSVAAKLTTS